RQSSRAAAERNVELDLRRNGARMSDFYTELQGVAAEVLGEFKQGVVTLTRITKGDVDPEEPWVIPEDNVQSEVLDAAVKRVSEELVDGSTILATDLEVVAVVPAMGPRESDILDIDGKVVRIIRILPKPAAGTPVAYRFVVRG